VTRVLATIAASQQVRTGWAVQRSGVAGVVLVVGVALGVSACGGGDSSSAQRAPNAATASTTAGTRVGDDQRTDGSTTHATGSGSGSSGRSTTGASTPHGTPTSTGHGTSTSTSSAPTTAAATTTTPPIPRPTIDQGESGANPDPPIEHNPQNGEEEAVCSGSPPTTHVATRWVTANADFVEINRGSRNYPPQGSDSDVSVLCPEPPDNAVYVTFNAFGKGGEAEISYIVDIDPNYRP